VVLLAGSLACAADPPPSTDDQLRDSLNSKMGDDYDRELLGDPVKADRKDRVDEEMQKKLQKELGSAAQEEGKPKAPLLQVAEAMRAVQPLLARSDSGEETLHLQRQIVSDLEKLIEEAKKSGSGGGKNSKDRKPTGGDGKKPPQNPGKATENPNPSASAQESDPNFHRKPESRAEAAKRAYDLMIESFRPELQKHDRGEMLELPAEHFLPDYELEIEDYFRRLSADHPDMGKP
jgi:hypothetical protein